MLGPRQLPATRRILLVLAIGIVGPACILAYFSFKQLAVERYRQRQDLLTSYDELARTKVTLIEGLVARWEEDILALTMGKSVSGIAAAFDAAVQEKGVVEAGFVLYPNFKLAYPSSALRPEELREDDVTSELDWDEARDLFRGYQREFGEGNPRAALPLYRRCAQRAASPAVRARAAFAVASVYHHLGRLEAAMENYRRLEQVSASDPHSLWLVALSRLRRGEAEIAAGRFGDALTTLGELYGDISEDRYPFGKGFRTQLLREKVTGAIDGLVAAGHAPDAFRQSYRAARVAFLARQRRNELASSLVGFLVAKIALAVAAAPPPEGEPGLFYETVGATPYPIVWWRQIDPETVGARLTVGFKMDLEYLEEIIGGRLVMEQGSPSRPALTVATLDGKRVFGEHAPAGSEPLVVRSFVGALPFLRLEIRERHPELAEAAANRRMYLYFGFLGTVALVIMVSVYVAIRATIAQLELSQMKSDFVSRVSHELKTPLSLIRLFGETLLMGRVKDSQRQEEYSRVIVKESERLSHLIERVLDFSRMEAGKKEYHFAMEDVSEIVRQAVTLCEPEARDKDVRFNIEVAAEPLEANVDGEALTQAVVNLVENAVKYSPSNTVVTVRTQRRGAAAVIEVSDQGIGIDPSEQRKIFEKFYRPQNESTQKTRGSGLGLALVKHAVGAHKGRIALQSSRQQGTTFTLTIPLNRR